MEMRLFQRVTDGFIYLTWKMSVSGVIMDRGCSLLKQELNSLSGVGQV